MSSVPDVLQAVPRIGAGFRLQWEDAQQAWVLLFPEGMVRLNGSAGEIMKRCDGERSVADMIDQLAAKYTAERNAIATDVIAMLQDLADKGFLTDAHERTS